LVVAASLSKGNLVKTLLEAGADVNGKSDPDLSYNQITPLVAAVTCTVPGCLCKPKDPGTVYRMYRTARMLIQAGADFESIYWRGKSLVQLAAEEQNSYLLGYLRWLDSLPKESRSYYIQRSSLKEEYNPTGLGQHTSQVGFNGGPLNQQQINITMGTTGPGKDEYIPIGNPYPRISANPPPFSPNHPSWPTQPFPKNNHPASPYQEPLYPGSFF